MAAIELDPLFMRALALLRSKSKDSTDMLKAMLDEVIGKPTGKFSDKPASPSVMAPKAERSEVESKKAPVKRAAEKSAFGDALSSADSGILPKKSKIEADVRPSRIQPRKPVVDDDDDDDDDHHHHVEDDDEDTEEEVLEEKEEKRSRSSGEDESLPGFDKEDEKLGSAGDDDEMWLGLACVVCKELGISAGNTLIECQECHSLYHQKCHTPTVTEDPNDPRLVWYCAKCKRNMKKAVPKKPSNLPDSIVTTTTSSSSASSVSSSSGRDGDKNQDSAMNLFRRADPKPSPTSTTSKQQPFGGLASYAANLTNRQHSSSSKPSSGGTSRIISGGSSTKQGSVSGGGSTKPGAVTSRSSSISGTSSANRLSSIKAQGVQRSSSQSGSKSSSSAPVVSSAAAKAITSGTSSSSTKAMPQTSTESAMKRLHMMKKKASKR